MPNIYLDAINSFDKIMSVNKLFIWINFVVLIGALVWAVTLIQAIEAWLFFLSTFAVLVTQVFRNRRNENLQKVSNEQISLQELKKNYNFLKKISIIGLGNVGKTTLIEHICRIENKKVLTQGAVAYITNLSVKRNKFVAFLDASGQSQSRQNDLALESEIIIILLDHSDSDTINRIDSGRLETQKSFIFLLVDRLRTREHKPKAIFLLLNKRDLWIRNSDVKKTNLFNFFNETKNIIKQEFPNSSVIDIHYSNSITSDCSKLINSLLDKI